MKNKKIISSNLILSFFGIYLSFFYFGLSQYNYPVYFFFDIIKSSFVLSIIVASPLILILFISSKFYHLKKIFISILVGLLSYIVFHYLIRFSDINYYHIFILIFDNKNLLINVIFYFFPFIILFLYSLKFCEKKIFKINKFIFILLIILNIFSLYRTYVIYVLNDNQSYEISDYKNFKANSADNFKSNKKVFILLFDEFDQSIFNKNFEKFNNIKKFYNTSYVNKKFYSPAKFTIDSVPAILTGNSSQKTIIKNGKLFVKNYENEIVHFNHDNSLFNIYNISYSIFAYYHPYCKIFEAETCYDKFYFMKQKISLKDSIKILLNITYVDRLINIDLLIDKFSNTKIKPSKENNFSKFMIENSLNFLKNNSDIIYIHYPFPHPPLKKNIINFDEKNETLSDYEKNLFLVDYTFLLINKFLEMNQDSLLIVLSDHWHKDISEKKALPTVFFSKIIGDDNYIEDNKENNSSNIKGLIKMFFESKIKSNYDIKNYFILRKNHKTYVR
ncbi:hypothetical protein ACIJYE_04885 [Candidatus Pelagibacter bacterium nBUS_30]|uniref:hypothetical protein n=1 Tax=Candidatus Pelagibacter bacterium nBUS_30 TaxID=3374191 RepID=UPI003EBCA4F2